MGHDNGQLPTYCCIALLESCFFKCRMCYKGRDDINYRDPQEPKLDDWKRFISSLRQMVKGSFQINFAGGEPLARKETLELIRHASSEGFEAFVATNAYLIDEEMSQKLAWAGASTVNISLDSLQEGKHDYIRGTAGAYARVMRALELLDKFAPRIKVGICTTIMSYNIDEAADIARWIQANEKIDGMGFQAVTQPFSTPEDRLWWKNPEYSHLWPQDLGAVDRAMNELAELKNNGFSKIGNPVSQFHVYKAYFRSPDNFIKRHKCHIDSTAINITPQGEIRICFYMGPIGNIKTDDIGRVWFSQRAADIRRKISECKLNCQSMVNCNFDDAQDYIC